MKDQRKPLTPKEIKFVEAKTKGLSNRQAAIEANPNISPKSAGNTGMRMSKNVDIKEEIAKAFERNGITIDKVVRPIADGLSATKLMVGQGYVADHSVRLKASGMAASFMGVGHDAGGGDVINNFIIISSQDKDVFGL